MRTYAIGDIHGHLDALRAAHRRIARDREQTGDRDAPVVHLGDLVDRGPNSSGVIQYLIDGQAQGHPWVVLAGNHDKGFIRWMAAPKASVAIFPPDYWSSPWGDGSPTLMSYGVEPGDRMMQVHAAAVRAVPDLHLNFLNGLPLSYRREDLFLVHAGIRPGVALERQKEDDLVWIRSAFHDDTRDHGPLIVHGHTPIDRPTHYGNRVNLDTGAAFGGPLTVAVFEGRDVWVLTDAGRVPLLP